MTENNLTEWSDHNLLTGQVTPQVYNFFSKGLTFALSKPCPLFLCIQVNTPLKYLFFRPLRSLTTLKRAHNLGNDPIIPSLPCFLSLSCNLPCIPSFISKWIKDTAKLSFSGVFEIWLVPINCYKNSLQVWTFLTLKKEHGQLRGRRRLDFPSVTSRTSEREASK